MSLLLDALKKAAEQKAEKEEVTVTKTVSTSDDETLVLEKTQTVADNTAAFDEDRTDYLGDRDNDTLVVTRLSDESLEQDTEFTSPEPSNGVDTSHETEEKTELLEPDEQSDFDEDQTVILEEKEIAEIVGDYETTEIVAKEGRSQAPADPEKTVRGYEADETQVDPWQSVEVDRTEVIDTTSTYINAEHNKADKAPTLTDDDVTEFLGEHDFPTKSPVFSRSPDFSGSHTELESRAKEDDLEDDGADAEEISLSLMGTEDHNAHQTNVDDSTKSQITDAEVQILGQGSQPTESLNLGNIPPGNVRGNDTVTNPSTPLGRLTNEETVARQDATSTRTYAPDNYDRTLIRVDKGDATKLFSGMRSESDVVMTPDYAKKVFINKSSVQRFNNYKIYSGVAAAILLVIFIFGLFEYEEESENIDNSLRALKRDPMPNMPQRSAVKEQTDLFKKTVEGEVDTKTLALIENAGDLSTITPELTEVIEEGSDVEVSGTINSGETAVETTEESSTAKIDDTEGKKVVATAKTTVTRSAISDVETPSKTFQIVSKSAITDKDRLLKDAYAAYQRGDNVTALQKYNQVLAEDSGNRNALLARAAINVQNDNSAAAIQDYQKLLIANPKDSLAMSSLLTVASISPAKSESQLKVMIRDEPQSPHLNFALANVYGAQNRWQEAQTFYFTALENNPTDPNYAYNLAVSLEHIAKPKVAVTYYQRALTNFNNGLATFNREVVDQRVEILQQL